MKLYAKDIASILRLSHKVVARKIKLGEIKGVLEPRSVGVGGAHRWAVEEEDLNIYLKSCERS